AAAGRNELAIGTVSHGIDGSGVLGNNRDIADADVPNLHQVIGAAGNNVIAVAAERGRGDPVAMPPVCLQLFRGAVFNLPQPHGMIAATSNQMLAIGPKSDGADGT